MSGSWRTPADSWEAPGPTRGKPPPTPRREPDTHTGSAAAPRQGLPRFKRAPCKVGAQRPPAPGRPPTHPTPGERSWARAADTLHSLPSPRAARQRGELRAKWRGAVSGHAAPGCAPYLFQVALAQARRCCVPRSSVPAAPGSLLPRSLRLGQLMNFNLRRVLMLTPAHARPASPTTIVGC